MVSGVVDVGWVVEAACEVEAASLEIVGVSLVVGRTVTGGRVDVGTAELVVSVVSVGSKMTVLEMMTVVTLPSGRVETVVEIVVGGADSGAEEIVDVGNGVGMVDDEPKRESERLVRMSPNVELMEADAVDWKVVLSGAGGKVSCLVLVEFTNCRLT